MQLNTEYSQNRESRRISIFLSWLESNRASRGLEALADTIGAQSAHLSTHCTLTARAGQSRATLPAGLRLRDQVRFRRAQGSLLLVGECSAFLASGSDPTDG